MKILALCGSIRKDSSNYSLLLAIKQMTEITSQFDIFDIKQLPYFDPNHQFGESVPEVVQKLRSLAKASKYILLSTPEYAHGIPGILKNALEWLICEETMKKPVIVVVGSPSGGQYVKEYLCETIRTMDMLVPAENVLVLKTIRGQVSETGQIQDSELKQQVKDFIKTIGL